MGLLSNVISNVKNAFTKKKPKTPQTQKTSTKEMIGIIDETAKNKPKPIDNKGTIGPRMQAGTAAPETASDVADIASLGTGFIAKSAVKTGGKALATAGTEGFLGKAGKTASADLIAKGREMLLKGGFSKGTTESAINRWIDKTAVSKLEAMEQSKILALIKHPATKITTGIAGTLAGASGLSTWLASDNIITGTGITANKLTKAVQGGSLTKEEALTEIDNLQRTKDAALKFVNLNTLINPIMLPFRSTFLKNAELAQTNLDLEREAIMNAVTEDEKRNADKEFYDKIAADKTQAEADKRASDEKYWAEINRQNAQRKEDERKKDEEYWAKKKMESTMSKFNAPASSDINA